MNGNLDGVCNLCGGHGERRAGVCFECASSAEERHVSQSVIRLFLVGLSKLHRPSKWWQVRTDWSWAFQRLTRTGDYRSGGTFDREGYQWR